MAAEQILHPVDIENTELRIFNETTSEAIVDEFYRFGQILFSESLQRGSELDRKLNSMLGWSTAVLAFLLHNQLKGNQFGIFWWIGIVVPTASALLAALITSFALKTRMWAAPSELDWFRDDLWEDPPRMKRYHVISLLLAHQEQTKNVARKARYLRYAEFLLPISAVAIGATIIAS